LKEWREDYPGKAKRRVSGDSRARTERCWPEKKVEVRVIVERSVEREIR
jgi:hypothetical protein